MRLQQRISKHIRKMEYLNTAIRYGSNVANKVLGVEGFTEDSSGNVVMHTYHFHKFADIIALSSLLGLAIALFAAVGAARQSYCYNVYIGNTDGVAILFAILCFFFPQFYYPFYAIFLNPVCDLGRKNKGVLGGLIGGRRR